MRFLSAIAVCLGLLVAGEATARPIQPELYSYGGDVHVTFAFGGGPTYFDIQNGGIGFGFDWRFVLWGHHPTPIDKFATIALRAEIPRMNGFRGEVLGGWGVEWNAQTFEAPQWAGGELLTGIGVGIQRYVAPLAGLRAFYGYGPAYVSTSAVGGLALGPIPAWDVLLGEGFGVSNGPRPFSFETVVETGDTDDR